MSLPLMPGAEPVQIRRKASEPPRPSFVDEAPANAVVGCGCVVCQQVRQYQSQRRAPVDMAAQYGGTVTGCTSSRAQPEMQNLPRNAPPPPAPGVFNWDMPQRVESIGLNQGRIRGRYDPSGGGHVFRGAPRWLDEADGQLYDSDGGRANRAQFSNGAWRSGQGLIWLPD